MSDLDEITEQIRSFLTTEDRVWSEDLADAAAAYADACREVNDRVRRCTDYLRHGMRTEAVHLALCRPPLLHAVEALHLAGRADWVRACGRNAVPAPPDLLAAPSDRFGRELLEAFSVERSLGPLLARHRILALGKAPIRDRLEVTRVLAARDAANPCWPEEVRSLEGARLKEMRAEAKAAFRGKDLAALSAVRDELAGRTWLTEVPEDLSVGLDKALGGLRRREATAELRGILEELTASSESGDFDRCSALADRWRGLVESLGLALPPELQDRVHPIFKWLEAEERRRERQGRLAAALPVLRAQEEELGREARRKRAVVTGVLIAAGVVLALVIIVLVWAFWPRHT